MNGAVLGVPFMTVSRYRPSA